MSNQQRTSFRRAFVDTGAYYALTDPRDLDHGSATAIAARLAASRRQIFTSNLILAEAHALLLVRLGRVTALRVLLQIDSGSTTVVRVAAVDERRAREILWRYDDKDFSLTDATSFAVMERLGISHAFAFDQHFAQYGFQLVSPSADT